MHQVDSPVVVLVQLCFKDAAWNDHIVVLSKRRGQLKQVYGSLLLPPICGRFRDMF